MVGELANVIEKDFIDVYKLCQRIGAVWLNEQINILREDIEGRSRVRCSKERVEPAGIIFITFGGIGF